MGKKLNFNIKQFKEPLIICLNKISNHPELEALSEVAGDIDCGNGTYTIFIGVCKKDNGYLEK